MSFARGICRGVCDCLEAPANKWIEQRSFYTWLVIATTCVGAFVGQLDASIVQLALPTLEHEFECGINEVSWVALAYLLGFSAFLPPFARLSEISGRKRLYLCGYMLFTVASALCGFAPNLPSLIALRFLQGMGGSLLGANGVVILVKAAGPERQGRAIGIFAAAQAVGVGAGPAVGGLLVSTLSWHWVFWVSAPFGLVAMVAGWLVLPQTPPSPAKAPFDWRGALLLCPALASLLVVISEGHAPGVTWLALALGVAITVGLLWLFVRQERVAPAPLISLALLRVPAFARGLIGVTLSYGLLYAMFFLMSFAFVRGGGDTPLEAGIRLAVIPVALGLIAPLAGRLSERMGARTLTVAGMAACIGGLLLMREMLRTGFSNDTLETVASFLFGAGMGLYISPNNSATLAAAPSTSAGVAGGLLNLQRVFGTSLGVASAAAMLSWRLEERPGTLRSLSTVPPETLSAATSESMYLLLAFAIVAGTLSMIRPRPATK